MITGKIISREATRFEQHHREGITECERRSGTGGWGEFQRTCFSWNMEEKPLVRISREIRFRIAGERHDANAKPLQHRHQPKNFLRLSAIAQKKSQVTLFDQTEIAMQRLRRVQKIRGDPCAVERRCNLLRNGSILADAGEDQLASRSTYSVHRPGRRDKLTSEFTGRFREGVPFNSNTRPCTSQNGFRLQRHLEFESSVRGAEFRPNDSPFNSFSA